MSNVPETLRRALSERYTFEREIGAGGMGTVYLAHDRKHNRAVAIKVLPQALTATVGADRFLREIEIAAGLSHPNIVPVFDSGDAGGRLYYVMPHIEGTSLKELVQSEGPLDVDRALEIARDVADGLAYAHARGVIHRDIKPANILVSGRHGLIVDFGVALALQAAADPGMTATGVALGTPIYMSPEQFSESHAADARSDIYSLGCAFYEMLTGGPPFQGNSAAAVFAAHLQAEVPPVTRVRPDLPDPVGQIVARMLAKEPDERFQTAAEVVAAIRSARLGRAPESVPALRKLALAGAAIAAAVVTITSFQSDPLPISVSRDAESVVVLPFQDVATTDAERAMLIDLVGEVTRQLNQWESMRAVSQVALAGISFDLGLPGSMLETIDDGVRVAERSGVRTLVALTGRLRGETAVITATQFDAATGRAVGDPIDVYGEAGDPFSLSAELVHAMLGLEGRPEDIVELRRQSASPAALIQQADGRQHLESWDLPAAEAAFRAAIAADSTFAMAHHYLALTLYWQGALDSRLSLLAPEIGRASLAASRHAKGVSARDSVHINAFYRFQDGDYEGAREAYQALIRRDPTDVYALLWLGTVEYHDPWLVENPDGSYRPRMNLNTALAAFTESVRLAPGFQLGYGHLFDITERVLATADFGSGRGFELPRTEAIPPWGALSTPENQISFRAVYADSVVYLTEEEFDAFAQTGAVREGADLLLRSSMRTLRRWADFEPTEAQPLDLLVDWTLRERSRLTVPASPVVLDSLVSVAVELGSRAVALRSDTLPMDLVRLANIALAAGELATADRLVDRAQNALDANPDTYVQPRQAANVYIHRGQPSLAIARLARESHRRLYYIVPETEELVEDRGAEPLVEELRLLAASGVTGAPLEDAFQRLTTLWSLDHYSPTELDAIRLRTANRVAVPLMLDADRARDWLDGLEVRDPIWEIVRAGLLDPAGQALHDDAAEYSGELELEGASRAFVLGRYAQQIDRPDQALRHFSRLDSIPLRIRSRDHGWGLHAQSLYWRARAHEELGDTASAVPLYRRFLEAWSAPDDLLLPLRDSASAALAAAGR